MEQHFSNKRRSSRHSSKSKTCLRSPHSILSGPSSFSKKYYQYHLESPSMTTYTEVIRDYQKYMILFENKIEQIHEKENYRNYLTQQQLASIKNSLIHKKQQLENELLQKNDPLKSVNGRLHLEIMKLNQLQIDYSIIDNKLNSDVGSLKTEIKQKKCRLVVQKDEMKEMLKSGLKAEDSDGDEVMAKKLPQIVQEPYQFSQSGRSSQVRYQSKNKQKVLSKIYQHQEQKLIQEIYQQQDKLIMMKLFSIHAKQQITLNHKFQITFSALKQLDTEITNLQTFLQEIHSLLKTKE